MELEIDYSAPEKKQMRVRIALDLLERLRLSASSTFLLEPKKKFTYLKLDKKAWGIRGFIDDDRSLQELFQSQKPKPKKAKLRCTVCALGGLLVSHVSLNNKIKLGDLKNTDYSFQFRPERSAVAEGLSEFFSDEMLDEIEDYFEAEPDTSARETLKEIARNIIYNGGDFDLNKPAPAKWRVPHAEKAVSAP